MHALKISGCMLRSAVTNGLICCTCAAWKLYHVISYVLKYRTFLYVYLNLWYLPVVSPSVYKIIKEIDLHIPTTGLHCSVFPNWFFFYLRPSCNLLWNWWINFYLLPVSLVYKSFHAQLVFLVQVQVQYKGLWPVWGLLINSPCKSKTIILLSKNWHLD